MTSETKVVQVDESGLDIAIQHAQDELFGIAEMLTKGEYREAVEEVQSVFFMGDSDLEHECDRLARQLGS